MGSGNADDWTFDAEAGDRLSARIECTVGNARPRLRFLNPAGQVLASADGSSAGIAELFNQPLPIPGIYRVRVYTDTQVSDYRLRVDLSRGPALEQEPNDTLAAANLLPPEFQGGRFQLLGVGALPSSDAAGDFFGLGNLAPGNTVQTTLEVGPFGALELGDPQLALFRAGTTEPVLTSRTNLSHTVTEADTYGLRVSSEVNRDLFARYLLTLTVEDNVPPEMLTSSLPAEGATTTDILHRLTLTFSEPLRPEMATNLANYRLSQAGPDGVHNTGDDVVYPLAIT